MAKYTHQDVKDFTLVAPWQIGTPMAVLLIKLQLLWNLNSPNARTDLHQHSTFSINLPNADRLKFSFVLWWKGILTF